MRKFQIIRGEGAATLVEVHAYNGVHREFRGLTCVADALRHMRRICSTDKTFEILYEREAVQRAGGY
jgi:hypothetical protein